MALAWSALNGFAFVMRRASPNNQGVHMAPGNGHIALMTACSGRIFWMSMHHQHNALAVNAARTLAGQSAFIKDAEQPYQ